MKLRFKFGTKDIEFNVSYSNRKTLAIEVETNGEVNVVAPMGVSEEEILKRVKSRAVWIVQKQYQVRNINVNKINREAINGESYLYLGRNYTLQLILDEQSKNINVKLFRGKFIVTTYTNDEDKIKVELEKWYREKAIKKINERVKYYIHFFNKQPKSIKVKEQKKRWGSCTSKKTIYINSRISMAKVDVIDYIIVHEFSHLVHMNHSKDFYNLVEEILPDFRKSEKWLKENSYKLTL